MADATGNTVVSGTLAVSGTSTLAGLANANGGIAVDTSAFTVADATGNTVVSGTLAVSGTLTAATAVTVTSGGLVVSAGGVDVAAGGLAVSAGFLDLSSVSITDSQDLTPTGTVYVVNSTGATTITPTACSDIGRMLFMYGDDANNVTVASTNLLTTDGNAVVIDQYDLAGFMCVGTKWALMFEANLQ